MPEMRFHIRWPDGATEQCYSPSLVIKDYFAVGETYALAGFPARSRTALTIASERVQAKYGFACSRAMGQLAQIEAAAGAFRRRTPARASPSIAFTNRLEQVTMTPSYQFPSHASVVVIGGGQAGLADQLSSQAERHRSCRAGEEPDRACLADAALGHVLPGDAELAVPAAGLSLSGQRSQRLHAARRDRRLYRELRQAHRCAGARKASR